VKLFALGEKKGISPLLCTCYSHCRYRRKWNQFF